MVTVVEIDEATARKAMEIPKKICGSLEWKHRTNHAGHAYLAGQFEDEDGAIIAGLTFQVEVKAPVVSTRCLFLFTVFMLLHGAKQRLYQLEVAPAGKRTHNSATQTTYGPHEHIGALVVEVSSVGCHDFDGAIDHFAKQCSIALPLCIPGLEKQ